MDGSSADNRKPGKLVILTLLGAGVGITAGLLSLRLGMDPTWLNEHILGPFGTLFTRLLMMAVVPLVLASTVIAVFDLAESRKVGEGHLTGLNRALPVAVLAFVMGVSLSNLSKPAGPVAPSGADESLILRAVKTVVPSNPVAAIASNQPSFLHLAFFAGLLGFAAALLRRQAASPVLRGLKALNEISLTIIDVVMKIAPAGAACLLFTELSRARPGRVERMAWLGVALIAGLSLVNRRRVQPSEPVSSN